MSRTAQLLFFGATLLLTAHAEAYCRTTTCANTKDPPVECSSDKRDGICLLVGEPLFWKKPCASFSVQMAGSPKLGIKADQLQRLGAKAFDNWLNVTCPGGGKPNFVMETYPQVECADARYNSNARNQNVWVFRDEPWNDDESVIALTSTLFETNTGEIYDSDIEFNSNVYRFIVDPDDKSDDPMAPVLSSVVQHETGHVLGLAHANSTSATMYWSYDVTIDMKSLDTDDVEGVCAIYPPVESPGDSCDAEPRHGFSTQCNEEIDEEGCACIVAGRTGSRSGKGSLVALFAALCTRLTAKNRKGRSSVTAAKVLSLRVR